MRIPFVGWFLDKFERKEQMKKLPGKGALSLFFGVLLTIKLFPENIAYASIMILAIGDPVSHFVGKIFGRIKTPWNRIKMIEGNLAGAVVSGIAASALVNPLFAFIASFSALLVETIEIKMNEKIIDDNIILPLTAGTAMLLLETYASAFI
ncbi:MAG: hypothetical protein NTV63_01480 [Candidatus Woesearchaeota archaeon]|nr:hypothetical protein [Candidatus Woesearchaeota archaeon]